MVTRRPSTGILGTAYPCSVFSPAPGVLIPGAGSRLGGTTGPGHRVVPCQPLLDDRPDEVDQGMWLVEGIGVLGGGHQAGARPAT